MRKSTMFIGSAVICGILGFGTVALAANRAASQPIVAKFSSEQAKSGWLAVNGTWKITKGSIHASPGSAKHTYMFYTKHQYRDVEVTADVLVEKNSYHHPALMVRAKDANNHYICRINERSSAPADTLQLFQKYNLGSSTTPIDAGWNGRGNREWSWIYPNEKRMAEDTWYTMKMRASGNEIRCKIWLRGQEEPGWQIYAKDTLFTNGMVGLEAYKGEHQFDNVKILPLRSTPDVSAPLETSSDLSQWQSSNGTWTVADGIMTAVPGGAVHTYTFYTPKVYGGVEVQADVLVAPGAYHHPAITLRSKDVNNHYICRVATYTLEGGVDRLQILRKYNPNANADTVVNTNWADRGTVDWSWIYPGNTNLTEGTWYTMKFRARGDELRCKIWPQGTAEPDWAVVTRDSTFSSGEVGLEAYSGEHQFTNVIIRPLGEKQFEDIR